MNSPEAHRVLVNIFDEFDHLVTSRWVQSIVGAVLAAEPGAGAGAVGAVIADDATVAELNHGHRGLDEPTDVLAFAFSHQGEYYGDDPSQSQWSYGDAFELPPEQEESLGEVIVSYPQAVRQAEEAGRETAEEVAHLLVHGVLHLIGYDHMKADEEAAMQAREADILRRVGDVRVMDS